MALKEEFEQYAEKVKSLPSATNEDLLVLYGLFKQATVGDVNTSCPGIFDQKGRAKWNAWKGNEGKSQDDAMGDYITKAKQLLEAAGLSA
ncbi:Acyl-CoA-binding protein [Bienertia sinuspersici]